MTHSDYRRFARGLLRGKWGPAVLAGLIASILGAGASNMPELELEISDQGLHTGISYAGHTYMFGKGASNSLPLLSIGREEYVLGAALIFSLALIVIGSAVAVGYARYNLNLIDGKPASLGDLFDYFPHIVNTVLSRLLRGVYVFLWSLLLIVPGIIANYRYRLTDFLLAEDPTLAPDEAITRSKELMQGRKWDLFCLDISFIGWEILCLFTFGIGYLWLHPYKQASYAAFYRSLSIDGYRNLTDSV